MHTVALPGTNGLNLWLKRDDLLHPHISGNKARKLAGWLRRAQEAGALGLASAGGPHSQHLLALAALGHALALPARGYVRGLHRSMSPLLARCRALGMELIFVSIDEFRTRCQQPGLTPALPEGWLYIPMGAAGAEAFEGIDRFWQEVMAQVPEGFDAVAVSVGTGTFAAGLLRATEGLNTEIWGFPAFRPNENLAPEIAAAAGVSGRRLSLRYQPELGRFGQIPPIIQSFLSQFEDEAGIRLEPVYEAKMLYGLQKLLLETPELAGRRILAVLSGAPFGA